MSRMPKSTRRQQRLEQQKTDKRTSLQSLHLELNTIYPKTENQKTTFELYELGFNLLLHGSPGTGKSFLSLYLSLRDILNETADFNKIIIVRSAQASKNIGFLPGNEQQKMAVYEAPYVAICNELFGRGDAYEILKQKGIIEFHSSSFLRGTTFDNACIIIDEAQNSSYMELKTILTRTGENSKVIVCGDVYQDDLTSERFNEKSGLPTLLKLFQFIRSADIIQFGIEDIVRSGFVRSFIEAEHRLVGAGKIDV